MSSIRVQLAEARAENMYFRAVFLFNGSLEELRSVSKTILDALPQIVPEAETRESLPADLRAYQGIPDDIDWLL